MSGDMDGNDSDGSTATEDGPDPARSGALDVADEPPAHDQPWIDDPAPFPTADDDDGEDDWPPPPPPPSTVQPARVTRTAWHADAIAPRPTTDVGKLQPATKQRESPTAL